ncbi:MAG: superoxide dismutase family protein [Ruminococcus sp.]|nr:superoxide dismutase family protein [Ruminococcus sp.]
MNSRLCSFISVLCNPPQAEAIIKGSSDYPNINGKVRFYRTKFGVLVAAEVFGLPTSTSKCCNRVFGFHIHEGDMCSGDSEDSFANAMSHYNPQDCTHPHHAGDMPPLFENGGYAFNIFLTDRFEINEIIGRTVIIHSNPDDFTTQPSGDSGSKIACGVIRRH